VPVWLAHGTLDPVIHRSLAERSARRLKAAGVSVEWSSYHMGHEVNSAEVGDISAWLNRYCAS
jgi:phospholipase/carboxylesterase